MIGMSDYYAGHIGDADPCNLPVTDVGGECRDCDILKFCGGRCLYSNITHPWNGDERKLVCGTVRNLREALEENLPRVQRLIRDNIVTLANFSHEKFNGCEIIP
jgi:hypothetical protein